MIQCKLCQNECKSWGSLTKHLLYNHSEYTTQKYYDTFLRNEKDGICEICQSTTTFINISSGYHRTCGHKCGCTLHRKELAGDKKRHDDFVAKVSSNQTKIWEDRKETGEDKTIRAKIGSTISETNASLTEDELKEKFGWLNKLSKEEKEKWISEVMMNSGMFKWQTQLTKKEASSIRIASKMGISVEKYEKAYDKLSDKEKYHRKVWQLTEETYQTYINEIDPTRLRSRDYHLDHKFSISRGFVENIDPEIIASKHNLEILNGIMNMSKNTKCSINIDELYERYYVQI